MEQEYYLGLDIGTGSVGWAVTDSEYHLCRRHGKDLWGIRLFETANTAEERRLFRCNRRRLDRQNSRIQLLQEIFSEEITKVDAGFFQRLKESKYVPEDKRDLEGNIPELPYMLFIDKNYTDKEFHKEYPTIYHLRKELMESDTLKDIRLVYLALHHIIKHRGHFLFAGIEAEKVTDFLSVFSEFMQHIKAEELEFEIPCNEETAHIVEIILSDETLTKTAKATKLIQELQAKSKCEKAILKLLAGCKVKLSDIFSNSEYDQNEKSQICFSEASYEEYKDVVAEELEEQYLVIEATKAIYDWSVLVHILGSEKTLSDAKVKLYEKHEKDLKYLKQIVKKYLPQAYKTVFVKTSDKLNNYVAYIGMTKINGKKILESKRCCKEEFYAFLKKEVCGKLPENIADEFKKELELGTFLPKQVSKDNGVIPYQLQLQELRAIILKVGEYYPFIKENAEKLEQILTFKIPYYVGPLNVIQEGNEKFSWAKRRTNEKVYPWNFYEVIDVEESAEKFIRRMTNKCTYLTKEDVLPKESLLYSKFMVLNELNNVRINGEKISVELKQKIYENVFQRYRKVTIKRLKEYLKQEGFGKEIEISGIDGDFKSSLKAYHDFKEKLSGVTLTKQQKEELILNITLFGEDKILLKKRVKRLYPQFSEGQIKAVCNLNYKEWGRLSKKFLEEIESVNLETGEYMGIMRFLWETNENLMQLLSQKHSFVEQIEKENKYIPDSKINYAVVEKMAVSLAVKRQIWQTVQIVEELQKEMGSMPKRLFLEVAREKKDTGRTLSRKAQLLSLYQNCKQEERQWIREISDRNEHDFKSNRLYFYYTQKGRCMYCGKPIDLGELWDKNLYDIDHIYPQSKVMDDSLNNRVLTCKTCNANKTDIYPLRAEIREKMQPLWKTFLEGKFIEKEKYNRLIRTEEFSSDELAGFINRQLVETSQSIKAVAELLKQMLPKTEIVYVKAKNVSAFRKDFEFIKVREVNDFHHAQDAYLNIVVGNVYHVKFTKNAMNFMKQNTGRSYNLKRMFTSKDIVRGTEVAWRTGEQGTINTVKKVMKKHSILFTRRSYEVQGALFDQQIMKKGKGQVPIKSSEERLCSIEKYGGYNKATGAYFMLVESDGKKGKRTRSIEYVPLYRKKELEQSEEKMMEYLTKECELINPQIKIAKIKIDTLFCVNGFKMHLSGRSGDRLIFKGANQLIISEQMEKVLHKIGKFMEQKRENKEYRLNEYDGITNEDLLDLYKMFQDKLNGNLYGSRLEAQGETLKKGKKRFEDLSMEDKCSVLYELVRLFQCNSVKADLSSIGGAKGAELARLSKVIDKCESIFIIHSSITGLYEQIIDLKTV